VGGGLVATGLLSGRDDDRLGLAVAHAVIGAAARVADRLPGAETSIELTYQYKVSNACAIQPDLQYIVHPAGVSGARNALALGLRGVFTVGRPMRALATDSADPTVSPEG
jgi:porin